MLRTIARYQRGSVVAMLPPLIRQFFPPFLLIIFAHCRAISRTRVFFSSTSTSSGIFFLSFQLVIVSQTPFLHISLLRYCLHWIFSVPSGGKTTTASSYTSIQHCCLSVCLLGANNTCLLLRPRLYCPYCLILQPWAGLSTSKAIRPVSRTALYSLAAK